MNVKNILIRHNCVAIPSSNNSEPKTEALATVMVNLAFYGKALSEQGYEALCKLEPTQLANWWVDIETELKEVSGANRKIDKFVVYKNFPAEVLNKTEAEYWIPQILMYWGISSKYFTEPVVAREKMSEQTKPVVLRLVDESKELNHIFSGYLASATRWKLQEFDDVKYLLNIDSVFKTFDVTKFGFKENLVNVATFMIDSGKKIKISNGTDVLRLAVGLSGGDVSLKENSKFISFKKPMRKYLLSLLESASNLAEDAARRPELWKKFLRNLHPGDFKKSNPKVCEVLDRLFNDKLVTFNSEVEKMLLDKDVQVLDLLSTRPGEFRRRLVHTLDLFGTDAAKAFVDAKVLENLTIHQIVSLKSFLTSAKTRVARTFPPKGNWSKFQIGQARNVKPHHAALICSKLDLALRERLPEVNLLDENTKKIKLPSNDGEVSPFARGTVFPIPEDVKFIRTASYWKGDKTVWFDNGWNFFDKDWNPNGSCSWTQVNFANASAVFSGDPVNSKEMEGRAAQLIDLYPQKLLKAGVRYAVWSILCYSKIPFEKVEDVFAALQWGEDPQKGKLFEPSRCQLSFPLKGKSLTKYICLIDLEKNEMIYLDANLNGSVRTATDNGQNLSKNMPAFIEHINSLPSVYDLFESSVNKNGKVKVLYSDKDVALKDDTAYVFKQENKTNSFKQLNLNGLLA